MLTAREAAEFMQYVEHNPIDDQSNFHVPNALLCSLTANINRDVKRGKTFNLTDFLVFRDRPEEKNDLSDIDRQLLGGGW